MTEKIRIEDSSPLATVEDIQKRLLRPPSHHSPPLEGLYSSQLKVNQKPVKKKLEDYLDPVLLAAVSAEISRSKKAKTGTRLKIGVKEFEWPVDELKVFLEEDLKNREAIDLNNDSDAVFGGGGGDAYEEEIGSLFQHLEKATLKKFKH